MSDLEFRPDGWSEKSYEVWDGPHLLGRVSRERGRWYATELRGDYNQRVYGDWAQRRSAVKKLQDIADNVL